MAGALLAATIVLMLVLGTLTRFSGTDTTLGLAFANTGVLYPFFRHVDGLDRRRDDRLPDTASNVLFGGMQKVAAEQLGLSPNLMGAGQQLGRRDGQMIDAQSIVVAPDRDALVQPRGRHPALFFHFDRARPPGRRARHAAGLPPGRSP